MASLYSTKVTASGGRHGSIRSEDGLLDLKLALPRALGGRAMRPTPSNSLRAGKQRDALVVRRRHGLNRLEVRPISAIAFERRSLDGKTFP